jgi:hypothetical protein
MPSGEHCKPAEKLERLFGMSLDDLYEIMSWEPIAELDPFRLSVRVQAEPAVEERFHADREDGARHHRTVRGKPGHAVEPFAQFMQRLVT